MGNTVGCEENIRCEEQLGAEEMGKGVVDGTEDEEGGVGEFGVRECEDILFVVWDDDMFQWLWFVHPKNVSHDIVQQPSICLSLQHCPVFPCITSIKPWKKRIWMLCVVSMLLLH